MLSCFLLYFANQVSFTSLAVSKFCVVVKENILASNWHIHVIGNTQIGNDECYRNNIQKFTHWQTFGLISTAVSCSSLKVANADVNTTDRIYQTTVNVTCQTGYQFADDEYWVVTRCQADKTWSTQPTGCAGTKFKRSFLSVWGCIQDIYYPYCCNCGNETFTPSSE